MARSMEEIAELLKQTRFKTRFIGGVDEDDVWSKLGRMQQEYEALVLAMQERCNGVVYHYQATVQALQQRLQQLEERREPSGAGAPTAPVWEPPPEWRSAAQRQAQPYAPPQYDQPPRAQQSGQQSPYAPRRAYPADADGYRPAPEESAYAETSAPRPQGGYPRYAGNPPYAQPQAPYEPASPFAAGNPYGGTDAPARDAHTDSQRTARVDAPAKESKAPWGQKVVPPPPARSAGAAAYAAKDAHTQPETARYQSAAHPDSQPNAVRYHLQGDGKAAKGDGAAEVGKAMVADLKGLSPISKPLVGNRHG